MQRPGILAAAVALTALAGLALVGGSAAAQEPYHNYQTMKEDMQALAEQHDVAEYEVHGESTAGLELFHVDVAANISDRSEEELAELPTLYVDGAHHGNELLSAEATYYMLERVLENASEDASYVEGKRLIVNPAVNADGYARDQRENANGVDLNRNYPFHWGRYGTTDVPYTGNYRGPEPASEAETQANMALMESTNLYAYLTGHTGTYDIVLPWRQSEDGEIPDWPLYENTLGVIENETGLEYRDPSGAGEAHAWAYGNRTALGLLPEVSTEQFSPASAQDVEQRLNEVLQVYRITYENLTHLGGHLHVEEVTDDGVRVHNDGWGPAYNASAGADVVAEIPSGNETTVPLGEGADELTYERVTIRGDDPSLKLKTASIEESEDTAQDTLEDASGVPGPGLAAALASLAGAAVAGLRRG